MMLNERFEYKIYVLINFCYVWQRFGYWKFFFYQGGMCMSQDLKGVLLCRIIGVKQLGRVLVMEKEYNGFGGLGLKGIEKESKWF